MRLEALNQFSVIKQGDTKNEFRFKLLDYSDSPIDLTDKTVTISIANDTGKILDKDPTVEDAAAGIISFSFMDEDVTGFGDMRLEVYVTDVEGKKEIIPSDGYYKFVINRSLNDTSAGVTSYTLQYFTDQFDGKISEVDTKIGEIEGTLGTVAAVIETAEVAAANADIKATELEQRVDTAISAGTQDLEVKDARGEFTNLGQRLAVTDVQLAEKANQSDISTYVNIKKFGAKGDGVTDDSAAFKTAFTSGVDGLYIPPGTYIINITAGTSHTNRYFVEPANVTKVFGVKGKSIIKLGSGNCDERVYKGFHSLFNYHADDLDIVWDGITFDYNNANNPVYQTIGQYVGVENNIGQMAISATGRTFSITNCTFKDCSGTNVLYFTPRVGNTGNAIVTISHNKFQNMGIATNYVDGSNNTFSARHDCSTISLHNITETNYTLTTKVHDNEFIAADTNAYNTCESTGDIQHFYNNTVRGYVQGTLIEPSHKDVVARVYNNNFLNVMQGVSIWTSYVETTDAVDTTNSYKLLEIKNNKILIDPIAFRSKVTYFENTIGADTYVLHYYHGIRFSGQIKRNVDTIAIENNDIEFTYANGATAGNLNNNSGSSAYGSYQSGEAIGFWQMFDGTTNSSFTSAPYLTSLKIKGNTFRNSYRSPILMQTFPRIDYIDISGNQFYNCLIDITFFSNKELCKISYAGNGVNSPYKSNAVMLSYMKSLIFNDNIVIDTQADNILDINIDNTSFSVANSLLSFKNNTVMLTPTQYMYILNGVAGSIANKITDTASHN